jgi:PKD repeat protein
MSVNPQTYASLAANPEVHAIGEIWCDALWDMSWFLIDLYGFSNNPDDAAAGNNIALNLVIEGMKLQPCNPGFLDARDAIMTAEALLYNNVHRCLLWQAFARRGMGFNASQGSAYSATDQTAGFNMPPFCLPATQAPDAAYSSDLTTVQCGRSVKFTDQSTQAFDWHWDFGDQTTSILQSPSHTFTSSGTYDVKLVVSNPLGTDSVTHTVNVTPAFSVSVSATPTFICSGDPVTLNAVATGSGFRTYSVTQIPYAPVSGTGTTVTLADDQVSTIKPIGFTFNFFGQNYTDFYISSNGLITFSPNQPAQPVYGVPIPTPSLPNNLIALAWNDLFPPAAGSTISYFNTGSAPNRKLIVKYNTSHFGGTAYPFVVQGILSEGTNEIEIHTTTISDASPFDGDATTTQGVENVEGNSGIAVPGRNGQIFSAANDAYKFIQYIPYSFLWQGNLNGAMQTVNPTSSGTYNVTVSDGSACVETFTTPFIEVNPNCNEFILQAFLQGYYEGDNQMRACLYDAGLNNDSTVSDSITVELYDQNLLNSPATSLKTLLHTNGRASCAFPQQFF